MRTIILLSFIFLMNSSYAQQAIKPRPSPLNMCKAVYKTGYLRIVYSQPHKRGRTIFGGLVPYEKVWRTGANDATEMTITEPITLNGYTLKAGTYSLFAIPHPTSWTIIINGDLGQWGAFNYDIAKDVLRFDVPVETNNVIYEPFTILTEQANEKGVIRFLWDSVRVNVPFLFK